MKSLSEYLNESINFSKVSEVEDTPVVEQKNTEEGTENLDNQTGEEGTEE